MRRFLFITALILLLLLVVAISVDVALAMTRPLHSWDRAFPFQDFAEQTRLWLIFGETKQANYYIDLASQRTDDLILAPEKEQTLLGLDYLDKSFSQTINAVAQVPEPELLPLRNRLSDLLIKIDIALQDLPGLSPGEQLAVEELVAKVSSLRDLLLVVSDDSQIAMENTAGSQQPAPGAGGNAEISPLEVLFPPGSPGALHEFFPLIGAHGELDCITCHSSGEYAGTPDLCIDCHLEDQPPDHFTDECAICHTPFSWQEVDFDHISAGATDCRSCHVQDKPANHYTAQCSACHHTGDWTQVDFDHLALDTGDCQSCHSVDKPANHFGGQCSACHNTSNWSQASFNHKAVGATDCQSCHSGRKPANHFSGQCSACHSTSSWSGAQFNHGAAGATDCKACHSGRKPANHFDGQCSQCHTTSSWSGASFNHSFPMNHGGANGNCSKCHPSGGKEYNCFACHDKDKMINKHNEEGISNIAGRCLDCHRGGRGGDD